jgi:hypothetical protein
MIIHRNFIERDYRMKAPMANGKSAAVEAQLDEPSAKLF